MVKSATKHKKGTIQKKNNCYNATPKSKATRDSYDT